MRWLVWLGWLVAAYSAGVLAWMLQPGDRRLPDVVGLPTLVYATLVVGFGILMARFPEWFRAGRGLRHPRRLMAAAGIAMAALVLSVFVALALAPYRGEPAGVPQIVNGQYVIEVKKQQYVPVSRRVYLDAVESGQRAFVGAMLFVNLAALMGIAIIADDPPSGWTLRLNLPNSGRARYSGVKLRGW